MKNINGKTWRKAGKPAVDARELTMGIAVEKEHTDNERTAMLIALDHLAEIPDYYSRLHVMERDAYLYWK